MALFAPDTKEEMRMERPARRPRTEAFLHRTWAVSLQLRYEKNPRCQE
jgi:hypothetical protein